MEIEKNNILILLCPMAKNTNNRIPVKWVRDRAKGAYDKKDSCYICGCSTDLELHHTHSITLLLNNWATKNNYDISTDEGILEVRDLFIEEHHSEIYDQVFTLCNKHHVKLHGVYGKAPALGTATKQAAWIETQKARSGNELDRVPRQLASFSSFY